MPSFTLLGTVTFLQLLSIGCGAISRAAPGRDPEEDASRKMIRCYQGVAYGPDRLLRPGTK